LRGSGGDRRGASRKKVKVRGTLYTKAKNNVVSWRDEGDTEHDVLKSEKVCLSQNCGGEDGGCAQERMS